MPINVAIILYSPAIVRINSIDAFYMDALAVKKRQVPQEQDHGFRYLPSKFRTDPLDRDRPCSRRPQ